MMPEALSRLVAEFRKLPAVGLKTASRYAYSILEMSEADAEDFANAVIEARRKIHICKLCGDYTEGEICQRCQTADKSTILVVV